MPSKETLVPTQRARDAAAWLSEIECDDPAISERMRTGELDSSLWVQAFARFEQALSLDQRDGQGVEAALRHCDDAIREMFRYYDGGETRGSYDGKPERAQLRRAGYSTTKALAALSPIDPNPRPSLSERGEGLEVGVIVPWTPTEAQWGGLARQIMMWLDSGDRRTPRTLFRHLEMCGHEIPQWLRDEPEMKALDHVPSKGTRCVLIYRAMLEAASPPSGDASLSPSERTEG